MINRFTQKKDAAQLGNIFFVCLIPNNPQYIPESELHQVRIR